jgi:hypothetical protein
LINGKCDTQMHCESKRPERVKAIDQVRQQDQILLSVALEALLAKHSARSRDVSQARSTRVSVENIQTKGFALMSLAGFDFEHVHNHVKALFTIMEFPESFDVRFHGNLVNYSTELEDALDRFEEVIEVINRDLIQQLLLMDVMLTSEEMWRRQVQEQETFS